MFLNKLFCWMAKAIYCHRSIGMCYVLWIVGWIPAAYTHLQPGTCTGGLVGLATKSISRYYTWCILGIIATLPLATSHWATDTATADANYDCPLEADLNRQKDNGDGSTCALHICYRDPATPRAVR
jgi:hypothetical protein